MLPCLALVDWVKRVLPCLTLVDWVKWVLPWFTELNGELRVKLAKKCTNVHYIYIFISAWKMYIKTSSSPDKTDILFCICIVCNVWTPWHQNVWFTWDRTTDIIKIIIYFIKYLTTILWALSTVTKQFITKYKISRQTL